MGGTQIKLRLKFDNDEYVIFKPMRLENPNVIVKIATYRPNYYYMCKALQTITV